MTEESANPDYERTLGQVALPNNAFDLDLRINEGYQNYSAELLRISLLVITGLALVWLRLMFPDKGAVIRDLSSRHVLTSFAFSFVFLVISASAALLHRSTAADSLAYHLTALRLLTRDRPERREGKLSDRQIANKELTSRNRLFRRSGRLLNLSMGALICGVIAFGWAMVEVMRAPMLQN